MQIKARFQTRPSPTIYATLALRLASRTPACCCSFWMETAAPSDNLKFIAIVYLLLVLLETILAETAILFDAPIPVFSPASRIHLDPGNHNLFACFLT